MTAAEMLDGPSAAPGRAGSNPFLFVVGAARSGTTLLQRMLDAHPMLAVVNETYWVPRKHRERLGLTREGLVTPALLPLLLESPKFDRMGFDAEALVALLAEHAPVQYETFVRLLFDRYAAARGKPLAGDKTPGYVRRLGQLHTMFPSARFVHIVRDPRDLCLSMLEWRSGERTAGQFGTWQLDPVVSTGLYWRMSVGLGRAAAAELGESYEEVRYEDLVADPAQALGRLCGFLGLPYDEAMARYHEGRTRVKPGRSSKAQWLPPTSGLRDWRTQMPPDSVAAVEAAAGTLLSELGYVPSRPAPGPALAEHVQRVRDVFVAGALGQQRVLPPGF